MNMNDLLLDLNDLHMSIKMFQVKQPEAYKKAGFSECGHCNGTGLRGGKEINFACISCFGVGYVGFKEIQEETVCPDCNSSGHQLEYENHITDCKTCKGSGRLDWVDAVRRGVSLEEIW